MALNILVIAIGSSNLLAIDIFSETISATYDLALMHVMNDVESTR